MDSLYISLQELEFKIAFILGRVAVGFRVFGKHLQASTKVSALLRLYLIIGPLARSDTGSWTSSS